MTLRVQLPHGATEGFRFTRDQLEFEHSLAGD
jgi:hypothetical protein